MDKWEKRKDLSDIYFTTATAHDPPYVFVNDVDVNNPPPGYKEHFHFNREEM